MKIFFVVLLSLFSGFALAEDQPATTRTVILKAQEVPANTRKVVEESKPVETAKAPATQVKFLEINGCKTCWRDLSGETQSTATPAARTRTDRIEKTRRTKEDDSVKYDGDYRSGQ